MSDIDLEELRLGGIPINCQAADEIERLRAGTRVLNDTLRNIVDDDELNRLRSLLKEAGDALYLIVGPDACKASYEEECTNFEVARTILSKIKGEA